MPTKTINRTPARMAMLERVAAGHVKVTRNGALEPSVDMTEEPQVNSHLRAYNTLWTLYEARLIRFADRGLHGVPLGVVSLTDRGVAKLASWHESVAR